MKDEICLYEYILFYPIYTQILIKHLVSIKNEMRRAWQPTPVFLPGESHGQRIPACQATVHRAAQSCT